MVRDNKKDLVIKNTLKEHFAKVFKELECFSLS